MELKKFSCNILFLFSIIILFVIIFLTTRLYNHNQESLDRVKTQNKNETEQAVKNIGSFLRKVEHDANSIAALLNQKKLSLKDIDSILKNIVTSQNYYYGSTIAYTPFSFNKNKKLFAPYVYRNHNKIDKKQIEEVYDYTDEKWEWFSDAIKKGSRWSRPYIDLDLGNIAMITYSAVFYQGENHENPSGVVTIDISIDYLSEMIKNLSFGGYGYGELINTNGDYLHAPNKLLVLESKNYFLNKDLDSWLLDKIKNLFSQPNKDYQLFALENGRWLSVHKIAGTDWYLLSHIFQGDMTDEKNTKRKLFFSIILLSYIAFIIISIALLIRLEKIYQFRWVLAFFATFFGIISIGLFWRIALTYPVANKQKEVLLTNLNESQNAVIAYKQKAREQILPAPKIVKLGILIDSLSLDSANALNVSGLLWQNVAAEHTSFEPLFVVAGVNNFKLQEQSLIRENENLISIWRFEGKFAAEMGHVRYPLAQEKISLSFLPKAFLDNIFLLPDLPSYELTTPDLKPGINDGVVFRGWGINKTYFAHHLEPVKADLGFKNSLLRAGAPSLSFNLEVRKNFVDAFITRLTPLLIAIIIAFISILISTRDKDQVNFSRTGTGFGISLSATIFFVVSFSHLSVRQQVMAEEVFYLEYFYFVTYFIMLILTLHYVALASPHYGPYYEKFAHITKTSFFPIIILLLNFITFAVFY